MSSDDYNHTAVPLNENLTTWLSDQTGSINGIAGTLGINHLFVAVGPLQESTGTIYSGSSIVGEPVGSSALVTVPKAVQR